MKCIKECYNHVILLYLRLSNSALMPYIIFTIKINQTTFIIKTMVLPATSIYTHTYIYRVFKKVEFLCPGYMKSFSQTGTYLKHTLYKPTS
jgi:hypothetical protein